MNNFLKIKDSDINDTLIEIEIKTEYEGKNCGNCQYAEKCKNGDVNCNRQKFAGHMVTIPQSKTNLDCPCHSDSNREESRYGRINSHVFDSDDVCFICRRDLLPGKDMIRRDKMTHKDICVLCFEKQQREGR